MKIDNSMASIMSEKCPFLILMISVVMGQMDHYMDRYDHMDMDDMPVS